MGIKTKIYCGHDFSEEEERLRLVVKTCKNANIAVPLEVHERLMKISDGLNQIPVNAELEINADDQQRFRVKTSDIRNTSADYIYFEFERFKDETINEDGEAMDLEDIKLQPVEKSSTIAKFFGADTEQDFEYL
jgi:hypothetical protein